MADLSLTDYFDTYAHVAPEWAAHLERCAEEGISDTRIYPAEYLDPECGLTEVTRENYPEIYEALEEECQYRGVPMPFCYIDESGDTRLGRANRDIYSIFVEGAAARLFSKREMRALMGHELKHLYQPTYDTEEESREAEFDCDRAAVESVGFPVILSYVAKSCFHVSRKTAEQLSSTWKEKAKGYVRKITGRNQDEPDSSAPMVSLSETAVFQAFTDEWHPSLRERVVAMYKHSRTLKRQEELDYNTLS